MKATCRAGEDFGAHLLERQVPRGAAIADFIQGRSPTMGQRPGPIPRMVRGAVCRQT